MRRNVYVGAAIVALAAALGTGSMLVGEPGRRSGGRRAGAEIRGRSVLAKAAAERLGDGADDRAGAGRVRQRLDHSQTRFVGAEGIVSDAEGSRLLHCGSRRAGLRPCGKPDSALGQVRRARLADVEPWHHGGQQGQRVARRERRRPAWARARQRGSVCAPPPPREAPRQRCASLSGCGGSRA